MSGKGTATLSASHSWPLPDHFDPEHHAFESSDLSRTQCLLHSPQKTGEGESNPRGATTRFHMPFRGDLKNHQTLLLTSTSSVILEPNCDRKAASLDLERRLTCLKKVRFNDFVLVRSASTVQLRGGANGQKTGKLRWLKRAKSVGQKLGKGSEDSVSSAVTFKGREIGPPQLVSALRVLPPASRTVKKTSDYRFDAAMESPLRNAYSIPGGQQRRTTSPDRIARVELPPLPPPPALHGTPSRPATANPFAGIYGNPNMLRAGPVPQPVDLTLAGSLVDRPSALDDVQPAYGSLPALQGNTMLHGGNLASRTNAQSRHSGLKLRSHEAWEDRKWDALPALPSEGALETSLIDDATQKQGEDEQPFDTEEVLRSLRPERLSLYGINPPGHPPNDFADVDNSSAAITVQPAQAGASDTRKRVYEIDIADPMDSNSIHTREWDLQSCDTDDLGIDIRLERQREIAQRARSQHFPAGQRRQQNVRDNNETLSGLPEEESAKPEGIFYTELVRIVNDYHELLQQVIQGAYEAGEMSKDHYLREKWRHRTAMERRLQAAEEFSGYRILTTVTDIKEAVKQPTGYAIYSSLLRIRDPGTWQRVFEPVSLQPSPTPATIAKPPKNSVESSVKCIARKAGRAFRFMLAAPSDPELKTHSNRQPHRPAEPTNYQSPVSVPAPNTQPRSQHTRSIVSNPLPYPPHQPPSPRSEAPRPSTQTERPSKLSSDTTRVNGNTLLTGTTLVSPLNGRYVRPPRSRGYEQGVFVTVVSPSVVSGASEKTVAGYGAGKLGGGWNSGRKEQRESGVTAWPEADW